MSITKFMVMAALLLPSAVMAKDVGAKDVGAKDITHDHIGATYHAVRLETDFGRQDSHDTASWDMDAWVGGDTHKLWLKSEGEVIDGETEQAELWGLYSRNVASFWDAQAGIRYDAKPEGHTYLVAGLEGLAPYFFETEAHLFVRDDGALSARLRQENEILLTNRLIVQPYVEASLNAKDDKRLGLGTGLTSAELGVQTRYEITRGLAPYVDIRFEQTFGDTADYARLKAEKTQSTTLSLGIRWLF